MPRHRTLESIFAVTRPITFALVVLALASALLLAGCSKGAGGNSMHVKSTATGEKDMPVKSGYAFAVTKTFTDVAGKMSTAATYNVYAANYDLDSSFFAQTMNKPMTSDDQMRVVFSLVSDEGGTEKSPAKVGNYLAKADKFMKVESVGIVSRKGGAEDKGRVERSTLTGDVKVTSVSSDTITGEVDLKSGDTSIKGPFTAKILTRK
ncbi:MAG TPA: hypothetical protein VHE60_05845 [Pyrinomonadaceae bacterium]|nr:hypothetical protein [Pyrinomonadaceae bacterium]